MMTHSISAVRSFEPPRLSASSVRLLLGVIVAVLFNGGASAQEWPALGMVLSVDHDQKVLVVETPSGQRTVSVAPTASIRTDRGAPYLLLSIRPGDAVAYSLNGGSASSLIVTPHFWAVPGVK
jgi:hypothetical protein